MQFVYWNKKFTLELYFKMNMQNTHNKHTLITRTLGQSNDFTLLNGWICLHGVLD